MERFNLSPRIFPDGIDWESHVFDQKRRQVVQLILNIGLHSEGCMKEMPSPTGAWPTPSFMEIDTEAFDIQASIFFFMMEMERRDGCL